MGSSKTLDFILFCSSDKYYWIGLADLGETGTWTWQHSWTQPSWTHWGGGEPDQNGQVSIESSI